MSEWQDIETYDKRVTYKTVLLADETRVSTGHWSSLGDWGGIDFTVCRPGWEPTHWQPLPVPPNQNESLTQDANKAS